MRKTFFILMALCGLMLTGCTQLVDYNEQESDLLAEYMAGTVLRYTKNYDQALIYPQEMEETSDTIETAGQVQPDGTNVIETDVQTGDGQEAAIVETEKNNMLHPDALYETVIKGNYKIDYSGYEFYESYPNENDYFTLEPSKGKTLLTITFTITNTSKESLNINLLDKTIGYKLSNNSGIDYKPMLTLLENDMQYINIDIAAGKTEEMVILFEVSKDLDIAGMNLNISYGDNTAVLKLDE